MKRQLSYGLAAGAVALLAWLYMAGSGDGTAPARASAVGKPRPAGKTDSTLKKAAADRMSAFDRMTLKKFPVQDIAPFLSGPENTASHHIAAFLMTGSREFLSKAAELFPLSPEVFYTIAVKSSDPQERVRNLEKALSLDPDNSYLQLLLAGGFAANGQRGAAAELIKKAFDSSAFETFSEPIKTATRELALKAGTSAGEAAIISLRGEPGVAPVELLSSLSRLYESKEFKEAAGANAESLAVSIAVKFQPLSKTHGVVAMLAHRTERTALQNLPGDTPYGNNGLTVAMRLAQLESEAQRLRTSSDALGSVNDLSDSEWQIYIDKWSRQGQMEALAWVSQLKAPN